ncbi:MAG: hypothetical protein MRK02_15205 [Candidatus Scalindua sp.]|nr:hypothetical protein [Candidatus Scalindua sp.]
MNKQESIILGAGITGLAAAYSTGLPVFEAKDLPGGICNSYYMRVKAEQRLNKLPEDGEAYRFEYGGGHWIFGVNAIISGFLKKFTDLKKYSRKASVFFQNEGFYVPYPIQHNLHCFNSEMANRIKSEIENMSSYSQETLKEWLFSNFGITLCNLFFFPFHESYTAGLFKKIIPQYNFKTPGRLNKLEHGSHKNVNPPGYNNTFYYPIGGFDELIHKIASHCDIYVKKCVNKIDVKIKKLFFSDGDTLNYNNIISTIPLNRTMVLTGLTVNSEPDPFTSVLVLNIGAYRGPNCPNEHWIYVPHTRSGFYRIGFYSNVDHSFLPRSLQGKNDRVSMYIESAHTNRSGLSRKEISEYKNNVLEELYEWEYISGVEVIDANWIETAYTWSYPYSSWKLDALDLLKKNNILQIGRYGKWHFQGIADSIHEGLMAGKELN